LAISHFQDYFVRFMCALGINPKIFVSNMFNIFDLLSFAPMPIDWIMSAALHSSRFIYLDMFRLFRVFRLIRYIQHSPTLRITLKAVRASYEGFVLMIGILALNLVFFSTVMYFVEGSYCYYDNATTSWRYIKDDVESNFQSIISTFWWNIVSVTTTGYGDVTPKTGWGKVVASFALVTGVIFLAFPIAIFGTNFSAMYAKAKQKELEAIEGADSGDDDDSPRKPKVLPVMAQLLSDVKKLQEEMAKLTREGIEGAKSGSGRKGGLEQSDATPSKKTNTNDDDKLEFASHSFLPSDSLDRDFSSSEQQLSRAPVVKKKKKKKSKKGLVHTDENALLYEGEDSQLTPISNDTSHHDRRFAKEGMELPYPLSESEEYEELTPTKASNNNPLLNRTQTFNATTPFESTGGFQSY
jgi:hypothetical protein